jgi:hypothetical protein
MKQAAKFEIEDVSRLGGLGYLVLAKRLDETEFWLNNSTRLNGVPIRHGDIPRALDEHGDQRLDLWGFILLDEADRKKFKVGEIVDLESEPVGEND